MNIEDGVYNLVIEVKMESMDSRQIHMLMESNILITLWYQQLHQLHKNMVSLINN